MQCDILDRILNRNNKKRTMVDKPVKFEKGF